MKVDGPGKTSNTKAPAKSGAAKGTGSSAFSGLLDETPAASGNSGVAGAAAVAQLDALLALQETGGATSEESARKAKKRGLALLDALDQLKIDILSGSVPQSTLNHLNKLISTHRDAVMDPHLAAVLDEVDLRVQVEIAKLTMK